jgi:CheY-like chemotaxis protein
MNSSEIVLGTPESASEKKTTSPSRDSVREVQKKASVLIVEDELLVADNLRVLLNTEGYDVVDICTAGEEAIEIFEQTNPDLVLMDIRLAGSLNGIQTAEAIHERFKPVPILFLTAYGEEIVAQLNRIASNLFYLLTKPYDKSEILDSVRKLLKQTSGGSVH